MLSLLAPEQHAVPLLQNVLPLRFETIYPPLKFHAAIRKHDDASDDRVVVHVRLNESAAAVVPAQR